MTRRQMLLSTAAAAVAPKPITINEARSALRSLELYGANPGVYSLAMAKAIQSDVDEFQKLLPKWLEFSEPA